jgi:hypothetical protein
LELENPGRSVEGLCCEKNMSIDEATRWLRPILNKNQDPRSQEPNKVKSKISKIQIQILNVSHH